MDNNLSEKIYKKALSYGYDDCGIIPVDALASYALYLKERIEKIPQSMEFYRDMERYTQIHEIYPWAKSIVICSIWLGKYRYPESLQGKYGKAFMLSPNTVPDSNEYQNKLQFEQWMTETGIHYHGGPNSAPGYGFSLREAAVAAGIGIIRKNNFFYGPKGSYYELEGYLIDQECEYLHKNDIRPCPDTCKLCRRSCRTCALSDAYTMDPTLCISFLTTFAQGILPEGTQPEQLAEWICGCDDCQDVCPFNRHDWSAGQNFFGLKEIESLLAPENLAAASDVTIRQYVIPKTADHITPDQTEVLRKNARRAIAYKRQADTAIGRTK